MPHIAPFSSGSHYEEILPPFPKTIWQAFIAGQLENRLELVVNGSVAEIELLSQAASLFSRKSGMFVFCDCLFFVT
jgi:hypothetical protein